MKSIVKFVLAATAVFAGATGSAWAGPPPQNNVPEPGSLALVGLAVAVLVAVSRKNRK